MFSMYCQNKVKEENRHKMAERIPQTWTAHQEFVLGANGVNPDDAIAQEALSDYREYILQHRGIQWVHGGGAGGWSTDPYEIMTEKLTPEFEDMKSNCLEGCAAELSIVGPDGEEAIVLSCKIGGFATKKAALEQEAKCADCLAGRAIALMTNVLIENTTIEKTKIAIREENTRHEAKLKSLQRKIADLL